MYEAVEERATVVAEGRTGVGVDLELVLRPRVLEERRGGINNFDHHEMSTEKKSILNFKL